MKIFLKLPKAFYGSCLLLTCLLTRSTDVLSQSAPDSAYEKIAIAFLKNESNDEQFTDGQRELLLYFLSGRDVDIKRFYYHYRDSLVKSVASDTLLKEDARKKFLEKIKQSGSSSDTLPLKQVLDEMIKSRSHGISRSQSDNENSIPEGAGEGDKNILIYIAILFVLAAILLMFLFRKMQIQKFKSILIHRKMKADENEFNGSTTQDNNKSDPSGENCAAIRKAQQRSQDKIEKLESSSNLLKAEKEKAEEEKIALGSMLAELREEMKTKMNELAKSDLTIQELEQKIKEEKDNFEKLTIEKQKADTRINSVNGNLEKLKKIFLPEDQSPLPDFDKAIHSWFLLQDLIKGIQYNDFNVSHCPNFSKWILRIDTNQIYPEINTADKAGNAPIVIFCREMRKKGLRKISPDNSFLIIGNKKITQDIFEML
jgi:hypothetical protein